MAELRVFVPVDEFFYIGHGQVLRTNYSVNPNSSTGVLIW